MNDPPTNDRQSTDKWATIPNGLCVLRLLGSLGLLPLAVAGNTVGTLVLFIGLSLTDWLDGKIARRYGMQSNIGPRLDSFADASMYACLTFSLMILRRDIMVSHLAWLVMALASYAIACAFSLIKFGCTPSYHTWSAKLSWLVVAVGVMFLLLSGAGWPLWLASVCVTIANTESIALTWRLQQPRTNVRSYFDV